MAQSELYPFLNLLRTTLENRVITSGTKKDLKALLLNVPMSQHDRLWLQSQVFDMVLELEDNAYITWLEEAVKLVHNTQDEMACPNSAVYFSPGEEGLDAIRAQLDAANDTLDICVFTISDDRITASIVAAQHRGVTINIITDDHKRHDMGSDVDKLEHRGINIKIDRGEANMHHKFAIIDRKRLITGSYNWTRTAAWRNHENVLITEDKKLITEYQKEFDRLWKAFEWL